MSCVILVTGDRNWTIENEAQKIIVWTLLHGFREQQPTVVHGAARGVDSIADEHAKALGYDVHPHPANWDEFHKAAGPIRNQEMLDEEHPDIVLAFHDDLTHSKGTKDMVNKAVKAQVPTIIHINSDGKRRIIKAKI